MNLVDSSGWLEYFTDGPNAKHFAAPLKKTADLLVPVISIYEVFKVALRESGENAALQTCAAMRKGTVVDLDTKHAMAAAKLSLEHNLPMADALILSAARIHGATIWTMDADFKGIANVKYFKKK